MMYRFIYEVTKSTGQVKQTMPEVNTFSVIVKDRWGSVSLN